MTTLRVKVIGRMSCKQQCCVCARQIPVEFLSSFVFFSLREDDELTVREIIQGQWSWGVNGDRSYRTDSRRLCYPTQRGHGPRRGEIRFFVRTTPTHRSLSHPNTHPHKNTAEVQVICLVIEKTVCIRDGVHFS